MRSSAVIAGMRSSAVITGRPAAAHVATSHRSTASAVASSAITADHGTMAATAVTAVAPMATAITAGVMRAFRLLWNYAADRTPGLPTNPVRLARQWFDVPRRERLIKADELPAFYAAVKALPNPVQSAYLLLLLFTGLRREEAARLRWDDIDIAGKIIRLPAASTKAKRKLDLPMTTFVRDMLVARRAIGRGEFVFPAEGKHGHIAEPKYPLGLVADATGIRVSAHDLRRTFVTVAESADISPIALKALVNHS